MSDSGRADALLADLPRDGRGRLKVFLGAAPGVGKTYAMLQAAHTQLRQGVKLIAGVVETHGRAETEALLSGLPQQPLLRSEYRGVMLEEMDLDGLLAAQRQQGDELFRADRGEHIVDAEVGHSPASRVPADDGLAQGGCSDRLRVGMCVRGLGEGVPDDLGSGVDG